MLYIIVNSYVETAFYNRLLIGADRSDKKTRKKA